MKVIQYSPLQQVCHTGVVYWDSWLADFQSQNNYAQEERQQDLHNYDIIIYLYYYYKALVHTQPSIIVLPSMHSISFRLKIMQKTSTKICTCIVMCFIHVLVIITGPPLNVWHSKKVKLLLKVVQKNTRLDFCEVQTTKCNTAMNRVSLPLHNDVPSIQVW